jgi:hypothetical protein
MSQALTLNLLATPHPSQNPGGDRQTAFDLIRNAKTGEATFERFPDAGKRRRVCC